MKSIRDIIGKFILHIPPERQIAENIKDFLAVKKISNEGIIASLNQGEVFLKCDPYVKLFLKTNQNELLTYLNQKVPKYKISKVS